MYELTKSVVRFSWLMPLFGMQQMANVLVPKEGQRPTARPDEAFDAVTSELRQQLGGLEGVFEAGDRLQRGFVDSALGALNPLAWTKAVSSCSCLAAPVSPRGPQATPRIVTATSQPTAQAAGASAAPTTPPATTESSVQGWGPVE
ncbi:MAG: hypothetical protein K0U98_25455 [Deltaproteobacteria bacterium]|nr:hypothetical protein [Deltaproteobacteria bacterium]